MHAQAGGPVMLHGGCHCGRLRVELQTAQAPAAMHPRACDCGFCRKHGAAWVSDPAGRLRITAADADSVREYRQGSDTARFLLCARCGVLVAVTFEHDGRIHGAANAGCFDDGDGFGDPVPVSPQKLDAGEKIARWRQLWVPDVELVIAGA